VIKKAKCMEYDKLILNSHNKIKTMWNIINKESGRKNNGNNIQALDMDGKKSLINNLLLILLMSILLLLLKILENKLDILICT
jgi:hypothetical protein